MDTNYKNLAHRCAKHSLERKGTIVPLLSSNKNRNFILCLFHWFIIFISTKLYSTDSYSTRSDWSSSCHFKCCLNLYSKANFLLQWVQTYFVVSISGWKEAVWACKWLLWRKSLSHRWHLKDLWPKCIHLWCFNLVPSTKFSPQTPQL